MNKLSPELKKIVENATMLSLDQRAMVENHWATQKELPTTPKQPHLVGKVLQKLTNVGAITVFILSMWYPAMARVSEVLLVLIWLLVVIASPIMTLLAHVAVCQIRQRESRKNALLKPEYIAELRKYSKFSVIYQMITITALVVAVTLSGSTITAFFMTISIILTCIFTGARKLALVNTIKEETKKHLLGKVDARVIDV